LPATTNIVGMDEQHNGFDPSAEPVGPEIDDSSNPTEAAPQQDKPRAPAGREMLIQLQQMIDTLSYQAAPVVREIGAKAAELAAVAGQKAGPLAYKAAEVTDQLGKRVAARSHTMAADLRRQPDAGESAGQGETAPQGDSEPGQPGTPEQGPGESTEQF
jgi:hypothetical protein